jgi:hypothetical protein
LKLNRKFWIERVSTQEQNAPTATPQIARNAEPLKQYYRGHIPGLSTKSHTNSDLMGTLLNRMRNQTIHADGCEQERRRPEDSQQNHIELPFRDRSTQDVVHGADASYGKTAAFSG